MIRNYIGGFHRGIAVFIALLFVLSGLIVFEAEPQVYAETVNVETVDAAGEQVDVIGADSSSAKTVEEMESAGDVVIFEGSAKPSATVTIDKKRLIKREASEQIISRQPVEI